MKKFFTRAVLKVITAINRIRLRRLIKPSLSSVLYIAAIISIVGAKEQKVGYVDSEYIIQNYRTASDAQRTFETEIGKYKIYADSLKQLYEAAQAEVESQKLMLSEQGNRAKQIEVLMLKKKYDDYLTETWGKGGRILEKNRELITPIVQKIQSAVQKIAAKEGFTLILDATDAKIVYAQPDLDLTDKVLEELNKEYARTIVPPTTTTQEKDINIAIFPIFEENQEAQEEHAGETMRSAIFDLIKGIPKIRMISNSDVNNALLTRNISMTTQITDMDAYSTGLMLQADYVVIGSISKQGNKINFKVKVGEPINSKTLHEGNGEAPRIEELKQSIGNLIQQAIKKIRPAGKK